MIRVNLLPVRAARKKENIRRQVSIFFLSAVMGLAFMGYLAYNLSGKINNMEEDIEDTQNELAELEAINKQVKEIQDKLNRLQAKMDIIQRLDANRIGSVRIMDALTSLVVAQKMWLTSLTEAGGQVTLNGVAVDNKTVADFMRRLEESPYFDQVNLLATRQVAMAEGRKFKGFSVTCQAVILQPPQ
ncbi:MAG: PilN domain-containing protein [Desulfobacterales bacterium]|nr:MAG: PilN domain-containing protein [Desulfobacterales bacterium]